MNWMTITGTLNSFSDILHPSILFTSSSFSAYSSFSFLWVLFLCLPIFAITKGSRCRVALDLCHCGESAGVLHALSLWRESWKRVQAQGRMAIGVGGNPMCAKNHSRVHGACDAAADQQKGNTLWDSQEPEARRAGFLEYMGL